MEDGSALAGHLRMLQLTFIMALAGLSEMQIGVSYATGSLGTVIRQWASIPDSTASHQAS